MVAQTWAYYLDAVASILLRGPVFILTWRHEKFYPEDICSEEEGAGRPFRFSKAPSIKIPVFKEYIALWSNLYTPMFSLLLEIISTLHIQLKCIAKGPIAIVTGTIDTSMFLYHILRLIYKGKPLHFKSFLMATSPNNMLFGSLYFNISCM